MLISDNFIYWGNSCNTDLGHDLYGTKTGGGRWTINYPDNPKYSEKMQKVTEFISETFSGAKHTKILGKPIMSAENFNLADAVKAGVLI